MGRGLSPQQRKILALAYAFNRELHGRTFTPHDSVPAGDKHKPQYAHLLVSESAVPPDFFAWMLPHWVCGIALAAERTVWRNDRWHTTGGQYWTSPQLNVAKASCSRAASSLWRRGLIAQHRLRADTKHGNFWEWGWVLSKTGAEIARDSAHEPVLAAVIGRLRWGGENTLADYIEHYAAPPVRTARKEQESVPRVSDAAVIEVDIDHFFQCGDLLSTQRRQRLDTLALKHARVDGALQRRGRSENQRAAASSATIAAAVLSRMLRTGN
jgi:hypothetical protein